MKKARRDVPYRFSLIGEAELGVAVALRHIDNLARELRGEVLSQMSAAAAQTAQLEGNFNGDLKRMGGILADCVSQVKGIQVELSKLTLSKFESRLASVEMGLSKLGAMQDLDFWWLFDGDFTTII
eukprot:s889_g2.t1